MHDTRNEVLDACQRFVSLRLAYTLVPVCSTPHAGAIWEERFRPTYPHDVFNVGVRGGTNNDGTLNAFAIHCGPDLSYQTPLRDTEAYHFLRGLGDTLRFEAGEWATFVFKCDRFCSISEHLTNECAYAQPLRGTRLVYESGFVGYGVVNDAYGRSSRVTSDGELRSVREFPSLVEALKLTGRVRLIVDTPLMVGDVSGPPLL